MRGVRAGFSQHVLARVSRKEASSAWFLVPRVLKRLPVGGPVIGFNGPVPLLALCGGRPLSG